tara:strand:+ start:99 stop:4118 length:4020 start_codon:yes stop_codon:yes gene_type:complete
MGNIVGEPFEEYVHDQINARQRIYGKTQNRSLEEISYLNSRNAWIKLASGVSIDQRRIDLINAADPLGNPLLKELGLLGTQGKGKTLAEYYVLFNGIGEFGDRAGLPNNNNYEPAYGFGGQDQGFSPMPGIVDADVKDLNRGSIKKATINIKAHNKNQFDIIDVLYLRLGYTIMLEWGTDKYWDNKDNRLVTSRSSLIDSIFFDDQFNKSDYSEILPLIEKERGKTSGNYDALFGTISNFSWTFNDDGSYDIKVEMISLGDVIESLKVNLPVVQKSDFDPIKNAQRKDLITAFSKQQATTLPEFFRLYGELDLEGKLRTYYDNIQNGNELKLEYQIANVDDSFLAGVLSDELVPLIGTDEFDLNISNTLSNNSLGYLDIKGGEKLPFLTTSVDTTDIFLTQNLENIQEHLQKAIQFSILLNLTNLLGDEGVSLTGGNYTNELNTTLANNKPFSLENFETNGLSGKWVNALAATPEGKKVGKVFIKDQNNENIDLNEYSKKLEVRDNQLMPVVFHGILGDIVVNTETAALVQKYITSGPFIIPSLIFDAARENIEDAVNGKSAIFKPLNKIDRQRFLINNIEIENFLQGVFEYFKLVNAAGGSSDDQFQEPQFENFSEELEANQNKNRIYNYFYSIRKFSNEFPQAQFPRIKSFLQYEKDANKSIIGDTVNPLKGNNAGKWNSQVKYPIYTSSKKTFDIIKLNLGGEERYSYFIKLGVFLDFLQNQVILKVGSNVKSPLIKIDTDPQTNICYAIDNVMSTDIRKCIVRNDSFFNGEKNEAIFTNLDYFINTDKIEAGGTGKYKWGRIMQIYFNFDRIKEIIDDVDQDGNIVLFKLLKTICSDINESLGYINNIEPVIDKDTNTIKLIDQTPIPGIEEIGKYLGFSNFSTKESVLEIFGYNQTSEDPSKYTSTFVNKAGITTEISKNYATMITIGATANGSVPGAEATAFSKWNIGIEDRFKKEIINPVSNVDESLEKQNAQVITDYKNFIQDRGTFEANLSKLGLNETKNLSEEVIKSNKSIVSNFYKYAQAKISLEGNNLESSVGFLPFNLKLDMDGLSGIKIYNKINVNSSFLPSNYPQTLKFIVTGVNHKLSGNDWKTSLNTIATSISRDSADVINTPKLLDFEGKVENVLQDVDNKIIPTILPSPISPSKIIDNESQYGTRKQEISINTLLNRMNPAYRDRFKSFLEEFLQKPGYTLKINATYRTFKRSAELKKQDSENASPGRSAHNYALAIDFNLITPTGFTLRKQENKNEWIATGIVDIAKKYNLGWGGNYNSYKDYIHFYVKEWNRGNASKIQTKTYQLYSLPSKPTLSKISKANIDPYSFAMQNIIKNVLS